MTPDQLSYKSLQLLVQPYKTKERNESATFLNWFLENIFRLDEIEADDCICDKQNDKGVDGIYVDHTQEEIYILQSKIRQKDASMGDAGLKALVGTLSQFKSAAAVEKLLQGNANPDLKRLIERLNIKGLVANGYSVVGVYVTNEFHDGASKEFSKHAPHVKIYGRERIVDEYIEIDADDGVIGKFDFDISYVGPLELITKDIAKTYVVPIAALELVKMKGIGDGTLFSQNVRQSLGNTKVNKALQQSTKTKSEHIKFPLYHNGVTILCKKAERKGEKLTIHDYVVVNGAQSISTFYHNKDSLTADLRVLVKIIELKQPDLARQITINSNNQNAIKPRDLKSTNEVQIRLQKEFADTFKGKVYFEIKRGEKIPEKVELITNEEAGRLLLAFDLDEPESCHQVYKLFDEKYANIFARPSVDATRIKFLSEIMTIILNEREAISYKPLAKYGLTRFFLLSVVSHIIRTDKFGAEILKDPSKVFGNKKLWPKFVSAVTEIVKTMIVDLNYEVRRQGDKFDYKGDLKSPNKIEALRGELLKSYEKEVAKGKLVSLSDQLAP